jgi:PAS domain S-box-containing protein
MAEPISGGNGTTSGTSITPYAFNGEFQHEAQALLAAIVESSDDAIISKTLTGKILTWNSGAERLLGYSAAEAIGQPITMLIPSERQHEETTIIERLRRGERIEHFETVRLTKDERKIDVSLCISPVRDTKGQVIAASKVLRDITAQKQAQQVVITLKDELAVQLTDLRRLHEMSSRLAATLELEPILDETLRAAVAIENADMGLLSLCEAEGQGLAIGASTGFQPEYLNLIQRASAGGGACGTCYSERSRVVIPDIEVDPIFEPYRDAARKAGFRAVHSTPLLSRGGKIIGVLSTHFRRPYRPSARTIHLIDLCARQAAEFIENARLYAELRAADRSKEEFLAVLAHELRNPLAPIRERAHAPCAQAHRRCRRAVGARSARAPDRAARPPGGGPARREPHHALGPGARSAAGRRAADPAPRGRRLAAMV